MQEPNKKSSPRVSRRFTKGWLIVLTICLIVGLLLAGVAYKQRHQIHQFLLSLREPPVQTVHVTPLTLSPATTTTTPGQVAETDWTTYHDNNARSGFVPKVPDPTALANLWKQPLDGAVYAEPLVVGGRLIVVTENDSVYSLNAQTGQIEWHTNVGTSVRLSEEIASALGRMKGWAAVILSGNPDLSRAFLRKPEISVEARNYLEQQVLTTSGTFPQVTKDMDGQPRAVAKDVGADQFNGGGSQRRPLTAADVGPSAP